MKATKENLQFLRLFAEVFEFNTDGEEVNGITLPFRVKRCGRDACKALIQYLNGRFPDKETNYFGNLESGMMDCPHMVEYFYVISHENE